MKKQPMKCAEAKVFMSGNSQAIRIPKKFHLDTDRVYLYEDEKTGNLIVSRSPFEWKHYFELLEQATIQDPTIREFMQDRIDPQPEERDLL